MTPHPNERSGRTIRSVQIAFNILDLIQDESGIGVTRIANELGHSKSTVHSHLRTLEERRVIVRTGDGYRLSLRFLDTANHVREQVGNYDVVRKEVDSLAEQTGEIVQFGIEEHGQVSYLHKARGANAVETRSRVGTQQPMYSTSLGKTILAFMPTERVEEIAAAMDYTPRTENTITSAEELFEDLDVIRERGYGIDDEENINGLRCVSAPVKNDETILGAVSITGPSSRFTEDRLHGELVDYVQSAANVIELNTKFS
ncbi:IclR family transcriptional regulator [Haloferax namakaokahaiae]|uniref:IclR family transcriptional regulator n=1 Tax=Haloferax namakaokahaiae TaxID=1748331 RepID=A0ABD5ZE24_9EURY